MGHRNPDRIWIRQRYPNGRTVEDMIARRWEVISNCRRCGLQMTVRLDWIVKISGGGTTLWNRKAPCRRILCRGVTDFYAKAPGMTEYQPLVIDPKLPAP